MKTIKKVVLFMIFMLTAVIMGACANSCGSNAPSKENYVSLNVKEYSMIIGDEFVLSMDYDLDETAKFEYSSSNENVVTVDKNGKAKSETTHEIRLSNGFFCLQLFCGDDKKSEHL